MIYDTELKQEVAKTDVSEKHNARAICDWIKQNHNKSVEVNVITNNKTGKTFVKVEGLTSAENTALKAHLDGL